MQYYHDAKLALFPGPAQLFLSLAFFMQSKTARAWEQGSPVLNDDGSF